MKATFVLLAFALAGAGFARTETRTVYIDHAVVVDGAPLKAGNYHVTVENGKVVFQEGRTKLEESAKIVDSQVKFGDTRIVTDRVGQQPRLREIDLGGTRMRVEFN